MANGSGRPPHFVHVRITKQKVRKTTFRYSPNTTNSTCRAHKKHDHIINAEYGYIQTAYMATVNATAFFPSFLRTCSKLDLKAPLNLFWLKHFTEALVYNPLRFSLQFIVWASNSKFRRPKYFIFIEACQALSRLPSKCPFYLPKLTRISYFVNFNQNFCQVPN